MGWAALAFYILGAVQMLVYCDECDYDIGRRRCIATIIIWPVAVFTSVVAAFLPFKASDTIDEVVERLMSRFDA